MRTTWIVKAYVRSTSGSLRTTQEQYLTEEAARAMVNEFVAVYLDGNHDEMNTLERVELIKREENTVDSQAVGPMPVV